MDKITSTEARVLFKEILDELSNPEHQDAFFENLKHLGVTERSLFEWWETYLAWSECSSESDMEMIYG